jgi:CubicO group peptidase (beta-lactamase class C family)
VQEQVCKPLGIKDIYMGIPDDVEARVATLRNAPPDPNAPVQPPDALMRRAIPPIVGATGDVFNRPDVRRASIPGAGGIMSARALARHYAMLAGFGTLGGAKVLNRERVETARTKQTEDRDEVIGLPIPKGLGYFLGGGGMGAAMGPSNRTFGHPGAGGSIGFADPEHRLAVGFTKNLMKGGGDPQRAAALLVANEIRAALGITVGAR